MNLILIEPQEIAGDSVILSDGRARHLRKVLRAKLGDTVKVGVVNGQIGTGLVQEIDRKKAILKIQTTQHPPPAPPLSLILALPRPIMLKRVLAQAASLGVSEIHLIMANRVEKSFFKASLLEKNALRDALKRGLEQAVDTKLPEIQVHGRFKPFAEDFLPAMARRYPVRLLAHPDPDSPHLLPRLQEKDTPVLVAIGPEGGWVDFEVRLFKRQGLSTLSLGPRILRVDTAVPAILSRISVMRESITP